MIHTIFFYLSITASIFLSFPIAAQETNCFTALDSDENGFASLVLATVNGPKTLAQAEGYKWQAMGVHPSTGNLWAFGAPPFSPTGDLYQYSPVGVVVSEHEVQALRRYIISNFSWCDKSGRRAIGTGSSLDGEDVLWSFNTADPVGSARTLSVYGPRKPIIVGGLVVVALWPSSSHEPNRALVYDRRTGQIEIVTLAIPDGVSVVALHVEQPSGRIWATTMPYNRGALYLCQNPQDHPSAWNFEDRSGPLTDRYMHGGVIDSSNGVMAIHSAGHIATFRDGEFAGHYGYGWQESSPVWSVMVTEGGGAVIFGGKDLTTARGGWIEARSPDLSILYGRWSLTGVPTWMSASR